MRIVKLVLSIVGLAVIAWSIHHIGWAPVLEALRRLTWWQLVLVCLPYALIMAVATLRMPVAVPPPAPPLRPLFRGPLRREARALGPAARRRPPRLLPPGLAATVAVDRLPPRRLAAGRGRGVPHPLLPRDLRRPRDRDRHRGPGRGRAVRHLPGAREPRRVRERERGRLRGHGSRGRRRPRVQLRPPRAADRVDRRRSPRPGVDGLAREARRASDPGLDRDLFLDLRLTPLEGRDRAGRHQQGQGAAPPAARLAARAALDQHPAAAMPPPPPPPPRQAPPQQEEPPPPPGPGGPHEP